MVKFVLGVCVVVLFAVIVAPAGARESCEVFHKCSSQQIEVFLSNVCRDGDGGTTTTTTTTLVERAVTTTTTTTIPTTYEPTSSWSCQHYSPNRRRGYNCDVVIGGVPGHCPRVTTRRIDGRHVLHRCDVVI